MQTTKIFKTAWLVAALSIAGWATTQAQTTATWTGLAGGDWNTGGNWNTLVVPGAATNAVIGSTGNVVYNSPMTSAFAGLTNNGILAVNASGFSCASIDTPLNTVGPVFYLTNGSGAVTVTGNLSLITNGTAAMVAGTSLTVGGTLGVESASSSHAAGTSTFTNSGGTLNANRTTVGTSSGTGTGRMVISGGVNNLGNTIVGRYASASASTLGTEGLNILGGVVTMSNLNVSGASYGSAYINGGTVTNFGNVTIGGFATASAGRYMRVVQASGLFVVPDPCLIYENPVVAGAETARYQVTGGTNIIGGMYLGTSNSAVTATVTVTVGGAVYVGSQGIATNGVVTNTITLNSGGTFGATADWIGSAAMTLGSGTPPFTFNASSLDGTPHNITLASSGILGGSGGLNKTGGGKLLLSASNSYSGFTLVNGGTLALDVNGSIVKTPRIIVGSGATFDVSAVTGGFIVSNQTLSGSGVVTGAVSVAVGATIDPGSNLLTGTLSFSNSVTEAGGLSGAINHFDLSGAPSPNNDLVIIAGDLNVSGTNTVDIFGTSLVTGTNYTLIQYGGNLNGNLTNFALSISSPNGILTNDLVAKTISFIPQVIPRGPTNTVWIGNPVNTNWDNQVPTSTNWLITSSGVLDMFVPGDSVQFTDVGASNSPVNIVGAVQPASILVNSHSNYVFASTSGGWIGGLTTLTVTNTGTLTVLTTNTYSGNTTIDGGSTLIVAQVSSAGLPSAIGEGNLIINNGTFSYAGPSVSVNLGATLGTSSSSIGVASSTLTLGGTLTGPGALTKIGNGQLTLNGTGNYPGGTFITAGTIRGNPASAIGTNVLTLNGGATAANFQFAGDAQTLNNVLNIVGTNNSVTIGGNDTVGTLTGSGKVNVEGTGGLLLTFQNADMTAFTGTIYWDSITTNRFFPSAGTTINAPSTTFDMGIGSGVLMNRDGGNYHLGALQSSSSSTQVRGSNNSGSAGTTYYIGEKGVDSTFAGVIRNGTAGGSTSINKLGADTFTLTGANTYTGTTTVSNGVLALAYNGTSDGSIDSSATINVTPGAFLDVSGRSDKTLQLGSSQQLRGRGTILGSLNVSGTVAPGGGPGGSTGTLTVTNTTTLGGTAWMKLNRDNSQRSDLLVASTINYGGTLVVTNIGSQLQVGDTFTNFSATTLNNSFATLLLPIAYTWDTTQLGVNGSIKVIGLVSPPSISKVVYTNLANGSITFYGNYTNAIGYPLGTFQANILASTNIASPFSSWTVVSSGLEFADGSLTGQGIPPGALIDSGNITPYAIITVDPTAPQSFYLLQVIYTPQ